MGVTDKSISKWENSRGLPDIKDKKKRIKAMVQRIRRRLESFRHFHFRRRCD